MSVNREPAAFGRGRLLALIDVTDSRPYNRIYEAYRLAQSEQIARRAHALGWTVTRLLAEDLGTADLLRRTDRADAILIAGGEDLDPQFYGAERGYDHESVHFPRADDAQIAAVRRAAMRGTPTLGICRGMQIVNVAFGGTLVQDLGDASMHQNHHTDYANAIREHGVRLDAESRIEGYLGAVAVPVASGHHQAIARAGDGLALVASAPDGVPEAIEHQLAPIVGVQWHPESAHAAPSQFPALLAALARRVAKRPPAERAPEFDAPRRDLSVGNGGFTTVITRHS